MAVSRDLIYLEESDFTDESKQELNYYLLELSRLLGNVADSFADLQVETYYKFSNPRFLRNLINILGELKNPHFLNDQHPNLLATSATIEKLIASIKEFTISENPTITDQDCMLIFYFKDPNLMSYELLKSITDFPYLDDRFVIKKQLAREYIQLQLKNIIYPVKPLSRSDLEEEEEAKYKFGSGIRSSNFGHKEGDRVKSKYESQQLDNEPTKKLIFKIERMKFFLARYFPDKFLIKLLTLDEEKVLKHCDKSVLLLTEPLSDDYERLTAFQKAGYN